MMRDICLLPGTLWTALSIAVAVGIGIGAAIVAGVYHWKYGDWIASMRQFERGLRERT